MIYRIFVVMFALLISSCAANTAYISSLTDPAYRPSKYDPIFLLIPDSSSIEERQFAAFLHNEMRIAGFTMVNHISESKYILLCQTGQKTSQLNSTLYLPQTQRSSGYIGNTYYSGQTTSTTAVPYTSNYTVQKIYLELYSTAEVMDKKYKTAWEGYIGVEASEYQRRSRDIIRLLLDVFGTNYKAHTPIRSVGKK